SFVFCVCLSFHNKKIPEINRQSAIGNRQSCMSSLSAQNQLLTLCREFLQLQSRQRQVQLHKLPLQSHVSAFLLTMDNSYNSPVSAIGPHRHVSPTTRRCRHATRDEVSPLPMPRLRVAREVKDAIRIKAKD